MRRIKIEGAIETSTPRSVAAQLNRFGKGEIVVEIRSPGGIAQAGFQLYDLFRSRPDVVTFAAGECCSAAVVAFLGGSTRVVSPDAKLMIHGSSIDTRGKSMEKRRLAKTVTARIDSKIVDACSRR